MPDSGYRELKERLGHSEDTLPRRFKIQSRTWALDRTDNENFFLLNRKLDYIYNDFLLERTLVKRVRTPPGDLISASRSLLSTLLAMIGNRHRQGSVRLLMVIVPQ